MAEDKKRTFRVYTDRGWRETPIKDIRSGDILTIHEPDDTYVEHKGYTVYKATTDSYIGKEGKMTVGLTILGIRTVKK